MTDEKTTRNRRVLRNQINIDITRITKAQQRDDETLANLPKLFLNKTTLELKHSEIVEHMRKRDEELTLLRQREIDIMAGKYDETFISDKISRDKTIEKNKNDQGKKQIILDQENEDKKSILCMKNKEQNEERQKLKDIRYFYKYFCKVNDSLPNYIRNNLREMPNNKGYIFRGLWMFGELPEEKGKPILLFEKMGGNLMIHEYDKHEYKLYEKRGKEKKKLIMKTPRVVRARFKYFF